MEPFKGHCDVHDRDVPKETFYIGDRQFELQGRCPECETYREEQSRLAAEERKKKEQYEVKLAERRRMGVPQRYLLATLADFQRNSPAQKHIGRTLDDFINRGWNESTGLILSGSYGTGKTLLGAALVNHWLEEGRSAAFYTMLSLMRRIKGTWGPRSHESESNVIDNLQTLSLLVIDELGVQFGSNAEHTLFTDLINERYNRRLPSVLITNMTVTECQRLFGERVMDRFRDGGHALAFNWPSYRGNPR